MSDDTEMVARLIWEAEGQASWENIGEYKRVHYLAVARDVLRAVSLAPAGVRARNAQLESALLRITRGMTTPLAAQCARDALGYAPYDKRGG